MFLQRRRLDSLVEHTCICFIKILEFTLKPVVPFVDGFELAVGAKRITVVL